jgi:protein associated with RNAse G/E
VRNPVTVRKLKFDGSAKRDWAGELVDTVGESWFVVYHPETGHRTEAGAAVVHALRYYGMDCPLSVLVCFDALGRVLEYQCDAALPATISGSQISFVDLDLDVMADADLHYGLRDEDEFARRSAEMAYTAEVVSAAWAGVRLAKALIEGRAFPFDGSAERLLGRVLAAS